MVLFLLEEGEDGSSSGKEVESWEIVQMGIVGSQGELNHLERIMFLGFVDVKLESMHNSLRRDL